MKTYIETYDGEKYIVNMEFTAFNDYEKKQKSLGEEYLNLKDYKTSIKWNSIKKKCGSKLYMGLGEGESNDLLKLNEGPKKIFTIKERKNFNKAKETILEKTKEGRKKRFLETREKILKQLARDEERFGLDTTIQKLEEYKILKNKEIINTFKNK